MDQELFSNKVFWSGSNNLSHVNPKLQGKMRLIVQHLVLMKTNLPALNGMANYSLLNASKKDKNVMVSMIVSMVQMNWSVYWPALMMVNINVFMTTIGLCPWSVFHKLKDVMELLIVIKVKVSLFMNSSRFFQIFTNHNQNKTRFINWGLFLNY